MSVAALVKANRVVVFTLTHCPFCVKVKDILAPMTKDMKVYECDKMTNGAELRQEIFHTYQHETVPAVFINGNFIGGCDTVQGLQANGELAKKLEAV